jgi:WD40 repeat protein
LVWIIDGVDEADAPTTLLTALSRVRSASPIRLFFTSRPTKGIALFKDKRVISYLLQPADTAREMRTYTVATVGTIFPDDKTRQKTVVERILRRAEGNFLWVRLILNALQERWHTEEDIRQVLTETPRGMAATYTRMLEAVARQDERIQTLARRILAWTACGVRPLSLEELQAALAGEFPGLINIESTMEQICGNFVSVDWTNPDRPVVALIHSTARQFLLGYSVPDVEPPISSSEGHQQLAATCLAYLGNNDKWRRVLRIMYTKLRRNQHLSDDAAEQLRAEAAEQITSDHPLLEYASKHWAYHVRNSQIQSLYRSLETFFQQHCLSWIEVLAVSDDLSALATAARDLEVYAEQGDGDRPSRTAGIATIDESESAGVKWKTQHLEVSFRRISEGHEISENHGVAMAAGWARDLTRLVAKFGIALRRDPSIIYRRIPILCPQQSMVGQTYGLASHIGSLQSRAASSLSSSALSLDTPERTGSRMCVTGQVSEDWDDCLAMVRVGGDDYLTQILASKDNLIGLVGTTGTVKMWDAHTFEEIQTIEQGECVELMTLNITGTLVATAGFEEICIWELTSGRRVRHMAKPSSASVLTLAFGESDTELVAGLDDASVLWLDMEKQVVSRNFTAEASIGSPHLGCPTKMVLSPEKRWVAMAWRNRPPMVWELSAPPGEPPLRLGGRGLDPEQLIWRPDGAALFVLCPEALYEWRVFDDGHFLDSISLEDYGLDEDEAIEHAHIRSWKMAVSSDGKYLLTSDIAKTVSVWAFPALTLVHREADIDEMINDLIFSLDSRRFYDARGSACTVWIPDVLAHDADRPVSFIPSIASSGCIAPFESGSGASPQSVVTALAPDSTGRHFCAGRADGTVQIHDSVTGLHVRSIYRHSTPVAEVAWSASGALIVSCDESAHVVAKRVQPRVDGEWTVFPVLEAKTEEVGAQLVFNPAETHILISTASADMIWDLESKELTLERKRESDARRGRWVQSLTDSAILLWVDEGVVRKHSWLDLAPVDNVTGTGDDIHDDDTGNHDVSRTNSELSRSLNLTVVWAAHLAVDEGVVFATTSASLPTDITLVSANIHDPQQAVTLEGTVGKLLGMAGSRVAFLDRDSWVCTWDPSLPNLSNEAANGADDGESGVISASVTRHFFVPVDWLATSYPSPSPCLSAAGRALFFPKTDGVAVVWNGFRV